MSVLETLMRRCRRECEERRRYVAELERLGERLRADAEGVRREAAEAGTAAPLVARSAKLERSVAEIDGQITAARDALAAVEQVLHRHELAWARRGGTEGSDGPAPRRRVRSDPSRRSPTI